MTLRHLPVRAALLCLLAAAAALPQAVHAQARCAAGTGGASCAPCSRGTYSAGGTAVAPKAPCMRCLANLTTVGTGSTSASACSVCAPGYGLVTVGGNATCQPCERGRWSAGGNATVKMPVCSSCQANRTSAGTGASAAANCSVGICTAGRGGAGCALCPRGSWASAGNRTHPGSCTPCAAGFSTAGTGATTAAACSPSCSASSPFCAGQQKCDLTGSGPTCRASAPCPSCAAGFQCAQSAGGVPFCKRLKVPCSPPCAADETCYSEPNNWYLAPYCKKIASICPGSCSAGEACSPVSRDCRRPCKANSDCANSNNSRTWCDTAGGGFCREDYCTSSGPGNTRIAGCPAGSTCREVSGKSRYCVTGSCSPQCGENEVCDAETSTCVPRCGKDAYYSAPCGAAQACLGDPDTQEQTCTACRKCDTTDPKSRHKCEPNGDAANPASICKAKCGHECKEGAYCDSNIELCRYATCSPACPAGQACVEVAGKMACRPTCSSACGAGLACDLAASPPVCVAPSPKDFTLFIAMSERYQPPLDAEYVKGDVWPYDLPVGFLGEITGGAGATVPCNADPKATPPATASLTDEYDAAPSGYLESFFQLAFAPDANAPAGEYITEHREAHVDAGAALIAGDWSDKADVSIYATAQNISDRYKNRTAAVRPLDIVVALRHKATGALFGETYISIAPRPDSGDGDHCYTGKDALAAVVTVTTTPAKDRLAFTVKVVRPAPKTKAAARRRFQVMMSDQIGGKKLPG